MMSQLAGRYTVVSIVADYHITITQGIRYPLEWGEAYPLEWGEAYPLRVCKYVGFPSCVVSGSSRPFASSSSPR